MSPQKQPPPVGPVLIVSAFAPELGPLSAWLRDEERESNLSSPICSPVGIGLVDAAAGAAAEIERTRPRAVLFVGTAGSYGRQPAIGQAVVARRVHLASTAVVRGQGYLPAPMRRVVTADAGLRRALLRAGRSNAAAADVASSLAITRSLRLAGQLAIAHSTAVENLEAFAVATAARRAGVRFGAVLGIANHVGPQAHREWSKHQARATAAACAVVIAWLAETSARHHAPIAARAPRQAPVRVPSRARSLPTPRA